MNILFVSSEVEPFAKTGGLADVLGALPAALSKRGHKCSVILPFYKCIKDAKFSPQFIKEIDQFKLYFLEQGDVDVYFIDKDEFYNRDYLYGTSQGDYPDNALRFGFFSKFVISAIPHIGKIDLIHCNDWQTALIPLFIRLFHKDAPRILFTIHNMAYQGLFEKKFLKQLGLPESLFVSEELEFWGKLNFMKAGILYSDAISTVSEGYAREILTEEFGCGLGGLLRTKKDNLYGIVNGVDYSIWNPSDDKFIAKNYSETDLSGKGYCKKDLLKEFGIEYDPNKPLIGMITRLAEQKGLDIIAKCMEDLLNLDVNYVLLGFGDEEYNNIFRKLSEKYKGKMGAKITFDNALAHKIEAGSDMFLMPSRYEPCGLNQLYSLKYATVPIVRAVGGLEDTVEDFDVSTGKGTGFKFKDVTCDDVLSTVKRACSVYKDKKMWDALIRNGLACDYSWEASAEKYERLYAKLIRK